MANLRKQLVGAALAGMLMTGTFASPALASSPPTEDDSKINVTVYKKKHGKAKDREVEHKNLKIKDAAKFAADKCNVKAKKLQPKAWEAEYREGKVYACSYKKNKKTTLYVWFEDNDDKSKDKDHDKGKGKGGEK